MASGIVGARTSWRQVAGYGAGGAVGALVLVVVRDARVAVVRRARLQCACALVGPCAVYGLRCHVRTRTVPRFGWVPFWRGDWRLDE